MVVGTATSPQCERLDQSCESGKSCSSKGLVAGADYSKEACYVHALQHQPDGVVAGTAYSEKARYEQLLQHQPNDTIA